MAIYLCFLQHILYSMKEGGKAAIVVPTGFLSTAQRGNKIAFLIRKYIVDRKMLRGVVSMPSNIFANTGTNVSILFLDSSSQYENALLVDASKLGIKKKLDGKNQRTVLSGDEIERIVSTFVSKREIDDFSVSVSMGELEERGYSFSAGQYFEVKLEYLDLSEQDFYSEIEQHTKTLQKLFEIEDGLRADLFTQLKGVHFE